MEYTGIPESYCRAIAGVLRTRTIYIDIYDPYPNIKRLFWHKEGYDLRMNPPGCHGDIGVFWDGKVHETAKRRAYKTTFAVLHEPRCKEPRNYQRVTATRDEWTGILAHDPKMLSMPNVHLGLAAGTWTGPQGTQSLSPKRHDKPVLITMINSRKARPNSKLDGYRMRYAAAQELIRRGITVYGSGGTVRIPEVVGTGGDKVATLAPAQFSVEAECHKQDNWFTEKLIDCFLMMVVPVYYGPDNIHKFFGGDCMLTWNTIEELCEILDAIEAGEIKYEDFFLALKYAHGLAKRFTYLPQRHLDKIVEIWEAQCASK